jgi:hypothetical protein
MTMGAVITLWESLKKCQTITFIMNSIAELPWPPTNFISSRQWIQICLYSSNKNLGKILYNQYAEFLLHFQKQQEVMKWLALKRVLLEGIWSLEISKLIQEPCMDRIPRNWTVTIKRDLLKRGLRSWHVASGHPRQSCGYKQYEGTHYWKQEVRYLIDNLIDCKP